MSDALTAFVVTLVLTVVFGCGTAVIGDRIRHGNWFWKVGKK